MITALSLIAAITCSAYGQAELKGEVAIDQLDEASGLAFSAAGDWLWSHNDSGDTARLFAFDLQGRDRGQVVLVDRQAFDWEDLSAGPCGTQHCLYIGDIGDNFSQRDQIEVLRLVEPPSPGAGRVTEVESELIALQYPGGARDAESLAVDPLTGDLLIISKLRDRPISEVFLLSAEAWADPPLRTLRLIDEFEWPGAGLAAQATAASITPNAERLFVQTYTQALWFDLKRQDGRITGLGAASPAPNWSLGQCEAAAFAPDGESLWFTCEGSPAPLASANCILHEPPDNPTDDRTEGCGGCQASPSFHLWALLLLSWRWRGRTKRVQGSRSMK
jgi:hypothetical protein